MKYINAADVLPEKLLKEVQMYTKGNLLYIPNFEEKKAWGEKSGSREYFMKRNKEIQTDYGNGHSIADLMFKYGLAFDTIKKIIYSKNNKY